MKSYKKHKHQVIEYNFQTKKYNKFVKKYKYMYSHILKKEILNKIRNCFFYLKKLII